MPIVKFTRHLVRFFPDLKNEQTVDADTVAGVLSALEREYPGLSGYIVDETGALRKHVHIFLGDDLIEDRQSLSDTVTPDQRVYIFQALSGG